MRKIVGAAAAAVAAAACVVVGPAGSAAAAPELNGPYNLTVDLSQAPLKNPGVKTYQWTATPCGPDCARVVGQGNPGADMRVVNGKWELVQNNTLMGCAAPGPDVTITTTLDPATLQGWQNTFNHCAQMTIEGPASLTPA
jgi:hypothetical protein